MATSHNSAHRTLSRRDFVLATLLFASTDGTVSQQALDDNGGQTSPFFGVARVYCAGDAWDNSNFALTQTAGRVRTWEPFNST